MKKESRPIIFLAFANDRFDKRRYLRNLPQELRLVREKLNEAERAGLCEVLVRTNTTHDDLLNVFQNEAYRGRIAIFHYGGHAGDYELLLETPEGSPHRAHAGGLAEFLGLQNGLQLVFLNGCSTQAHVEGLQEAGVPAIIATSRSIDDEVATNLSVRFYTGLASGIGLESAFKESVAAVKLKWGHSSNKPETESLSESDRGARSTPHQIDQWPWSLTIRPGAETVKSWNLPEAAGDPLFGLPALPEVPLPSSPYRHLQPFTRSDAELFFGRGREIRALYELITSNNALPIILFYGQSGVGKSSMLDAGLLPRLIQSQEVRYARYDVSRGLSGVLEDVLFSVNDEKDLRESWLKIEKEIERPLVVILDQVEEVFSGSLVDEELNAFLNSLKNLFDDSNHYPKGKLVLGFRKEWLAEIETQFEERNIPKTKFYLERLDRIGLLEVIYGPSENERLKQQYRLTMEEGLAEIIADDLLEDRESPLAPTLQVLLSKMWTHADHNSPRFDTELYQTLKKDGILLDDFIENQLTELKITFAEASDSGLILDLLSKHTTALGTAKSCLRIQLHNMYESVHGNLDSLLQACTDRFLLTKVGSQTSTSTRLTHDTLAPLIRRRYRDSDRPGQRAVRILENRIRETKSKSAPIPLDEIDLMTVEQGRTGMAVWTDAERRLIDVSRAARSRRHAKQKLTRVLGITAILLIAASSLLAWTLRNPSRD